jgi:hypothetical protein
MKITTLTTSALLVCLLLFSPLASAQLYAFGGFGWAKASINGNPSFSADASPYFTAGGGYVFSKHLALEASYLHTGEATSTTSSATATNRVTVTGQEADLSGFGISAVGMLPIGSRLALVGKLGVIRVETEVRSVVALNDTSSGQPVTTSTAESRSSDTTWSPVVGLGAQYEVAPKFNVRAMFEQLSGSGPLEHLRSFSLQAVVAF